MQMGNKLTQTSQSQYYGGSFERGGLGPLVQTHCSLWVTYTKFDLRWARTVKPLNSDKIFFFKLVDYCYV